MRPFFRIDADSWGLADVYNIRRLSAVHFVVVVGSLSPSGRIKRMGGPMDKSLTQLASGCLAALDFGFLVSYFGGFSSLFSPLLFFFFFFVSFIHFDSFLFFFSWIFLLLTPFYDLRRFFWIFSYFCRRSFP